jgi:pantothenate kinase-related protein Tda10
MFSDLAEEIRKAIADNSDATEAQLTKVNDKLAAFEAVANKIDELAAKHERA